MKRVAVFVDAGYLYAQGSACIQGNKAKRENIRLDHTKFIGVSGHSISVYSQMSIVAHLLVRRYLRGPTHDHRTLADLDDVKLRLGFINSVGQQKGVDSLLVTDVVELSRNGAICDALLLGGDEDLRIGVQIAQSFGVRLHLIGIEPSRGSQSLQLRQEVDTKYEISSLQVQTFLSLIPATVPPQPIVVTPTSTSTVTVASHTGSVQNISVGSATLETSLDQGIDGVIVKLNPADIADLNKALVGTLSVPALYDRRVLASCRSALGRDLTMDEKKLMRNRFITRIRAMQ